jgi:hypothetical protein
MGCWEKFLAEVSVDRDQIDLLQECVEHGHHKPEWEVV